MKQDYRYSFACSSLIFIILEFAGKVALITGGNSGIGAAV